MTKIEQLLSFFRDPGHLFLSFSTLYSQYINSCVPRKVPPPFMAAEATGVTCRREGKHVIACINLRIRKLFPSTFHPTAISSELHGHNCFTCLCLNKSAQGGRDYQGWFKPWGLPAWKYSGAGSTGSIWQYRKRLHIWHMAL